MTLVVSRPTVKSLAPAIAPGRHRSRPLNATLVAREDLGVTMARFRFRPDDVPTRFVAGQYAAIAMADPAVAARPYSIASSPGAREFDFVISLVEDGVLTPPLFGLRVGDRVHVGEPRGRFRLDEGDERDHLLIGTGSGVGPLLSMIGALGSRPVPPRTFLFHGVRVLDELTDHDLAAHGHDALAHGHDLVAHGHDGWLSYRPTLSRAPATSAWTGRRGRVGEHLAALITGGELTPDRTVAYLCGSAAMIDGCRASLAAFGLPTDAIRSEGFPTS